MAGQRGCGLRRRRIKFAVRYELLLTSCETEKPSQRARRRLDAGTAGIRSSCF